MALVGEDKRVVGQIFEQGRRRLPGPAAGQIARIVLDAGAGAGRLQHLEVEHGALLEPLRLEKPPLPVELIEPLLELPLDALERLQERRARRDIVRIGVDLDELEVLRLLPGERIELGDRLDLVAEEADPPGAVLVVGGENLHRVAAHPKQAAREIRLRALVLKRDQIRDELTLVDPVAELQREGHRGIGLDRADAVDARHGGHDDDVVALEQRPGRRVAHTVDLLVDVGFLLDIGVGARDVGLRLVVVVIGDEVLHRVVRERTPELAVELRRQRFVRREDQRRALGRLDHLGHGEGLARAGDAEQHLVALVRRNALDQLFDRLRLVALRLIFRHDPECSSALRLVGARRPVRRPGGRLRMFGSPCSSSSFSDSAETAAPVSPRGWLSGAGFSNFGCGPSANPFGATKAGLSKAARCSSSGCNSGREALSAGRPAGLFRCGHGRNMGEFDARGKGGRAALSAGALSEFGSSDFPAVCGAHFRAISGREEQAGQQTDPLRIRY